MKTLILTKNQIWQLATIVQHYKVDQIKLNIDMSDENNVIINADIGNNKEQIAITDVSW